MKKHPLTFTRVSTQKEHARWLISQAGSTFLVLNVRARFYSLSFALALRRLLLPEKSPAAARRRIIKEYRRSFIGEQ
jgi:hypothetical protein